MWVHITAMGVLQTLAGLALLILHYFAFGEIVWLTTGVSKSERTKEKWFGLLFVLSLVGLLDAAYVWWVRDHLRVLLGILLVLSHLGVLVTITSLIGDGRNNWTFGRWTGRALMVAGVIFLDAAYFGLVSTFA